MSYRTETLSDNTTVPIAIGIPKGNVFSTRDISLQFPSAKIPVEDIIIRYPEMKGALDTAGIIWYLKPENYSPKGEINIVLVSISADSIKTYYIDNNNDRIYGDSEEKFNFDRVTEKRSLNIRILGNYYRYTLMNPDYSPPVSDATRLPKFARAWRDASRKPSLSFEFSLLTGGGDASISFVPSGSSVDTYKYQANIVGVIKPTLGIDFSWFNIHLSVFGAFERLQYDETVLYAYDTDIKKGLQRFYDRGTWPVAKLHGGITAEYDIRVKNLYFSPFATYSVFKNLNEVKFDRSVTPAPGAEYRDLYSKEFGIKLKIPVAEQALIYIKYAYSLSYFDVSDYILPYVEGSYTVNYNQNLFGIGIQYRLFR